MEIMDDVLDLWDSMGDALAKAKRGGRRVLRGERGFSTLVTVLVILAVGAIIITPLLVWVITGQRAGRTHNEVNDRLYGADTGIQDGMWRVSTGNLEPWLAATTWGNEVYDHEPMEYTLPSLVNGCQVTVKIGAVWLLAGLETAAHGREPHEELVTVANSSGSGEMEIVIVRDPDKFPGNYKLNRIAAWIPGAFSYDNTSSNLENLDLSDPAYCVPMVSDWKGGHTVIWDYSGDGVEWSQFASVAEGSNRLVVSFNYSSVLGGPAGYMTNCFSWCRTNRHDIYLSLSGDMKLFQLEATATDVESGQSITVIAGNMMNTSVGTYLAFYGDYATTGNALMRETGTDKVRDRLYEESPGEVSIIPESATVRKILLYWSGWKEMPKDAWYGNTSKDISTWPQEDQDDLHLLAETYGVTTVSVRVEYPSGSNNYYNLGNVMATEWTVLPNGSPGSGANGWSYGCNRDITDLVISVLGPQGFYGNATYWVGHADIGGATLPTEETLQGVWGTSSTDVFIVGNTGTIVHYNGGSWSDQDSNTWSNLRGVWGSASDNVWAVGESSAIVHYTGSWANQTRSDGRTEQLNSVWGSSDTDVWVVGNRIRLSSSDYRYTILHTTNGGTTWNNVGYSIATNAQDLNSVWGSGDNWTANDRIYAVGDGGRILRYDGSNWGTMSIVGITSNLYGVWGTSPSNVYAVGAGGLILHYDGSTWSTQSSGTSQDLNGVWGSSDTDVFAVGDSGNIVHSNGIVWDDMTSGTTRDLFGVWGTSSTEVYAVGVKTSRTSTILLWDGTAWTPVGGGTKLYTWEDGHSGETSSVTTDWPLSDVVTNEWANACWSIITLYTSPVTLSHQMYLFDTFRYWNSYDDESFTLEGFLAPGGILSEDEAVRLTCFVGEGDSWYTGDQIYLNGHALTNAVNAPLNNVFNSVSNSGGTEGYPPDDGIDLDTFTIDGSLGWIQPADSSATVRLKTGIDVWNLNYMILSFRSDIVGTGLVSYIVK